ncbi:MAG: MCE family protein [Chloroflexi bacterium]|nr:MAG: MCE family protein [Chloroflexota bacterium]
MMRKVVFNLALVSAFTAISLIGIGYVAVNMGLRTSFSSDFQLKADFTSANGLVPLDDVRVSGVQVGKVRSMAGAGGGGGTLVTMSIEPGIVIPQGTRAVVRPKSLLGEQFVELVRPQGGGRPLSSGAVIPRANTGQAVQIDDILNATADPQTRQAMSESFRQLGVALDGRAADVSDTLPPLDQTMSSLRPLARVGEARQQELDRILTNLNTIMQALADEQDQLGRIVTSGDTVMSAVASRDQALAGTVTNAAALFTSLDAAFRDLTPADRASLQESPATIAAGRRTLALTNPGIDQLLPELLLAQEGWPNNQLGITDSESMTLAAEWISAFSNQDPATGYHSLRITSDCVFLNGLPACTPSGSSPSAGADLAQQLLQQLGRRQ